ncbi:hypothetical protein [Paenibacillus woosongensis]|nr:hypothetical protein [Paenibacillus woosongensis]
MNEMIQVHHDYPYSRTDKEKLERGKRGRAVMFVVLMFALLLTNTAVPAGSASAASDLDLAYRWAPVHIQDTDSSDYDADYITAIDFDGDWDTSNNWENQSVDPGRLKGTAYYSIVETTTHWFILYAFYHPRDWTDFPFFGLDEHENDLEGVLTVVRKDGTEYGRLEAMVTVFHKDFYSFKPSDSTYTNGQETIDGAVRYLNYDGMNHPVTFQEAKGHGIKAWDGTSYANTDVIYYYPSRDVAGVPKGGNDRDVKYKLVDIFAPNGMWDHRFDPKTFSSWGAFNGNNGTGGANAPWAWDDKDDGGQLKGGELATDPAKLISIYFGNLGSFSREYVRNPYNS